MWKNLFKFEPETAHLLAMKSLSMMHQVSPSLVRAVCASQKSQTAQSKQLLGLHFKNGVGLAAGFDKNAEYFEPLSDCGFGFIEIGTVTPKAQPGNSKPRLFRDLQNQKIFNRMGFNNHGAEAVRARLEKIQSNPHKKTVLGVNIGKNKDTANDEAQRDYKECARILCHHADYMVINVSSPNTPGLRDLQTVEFLSKCVSEVVNELQKATKNVSLLVKLAPELQKSDFESLFTPLESLGVQGWILTNTLGGVDPWGKNLPGGWSGSVLSEISMDRLKSARSLTSKTIVSVGGILTPQDALRRLEAGADLVQVYSGWVLKGPTFCNDILAEISKK